MEFTTIRISKENYKALEDIKFPERLSGLNSALTFLRYKAGNKQ